MILTKKEQSSASQKGFYIAFLPLDQSAACILGLFQKKKSFVYLPFLGEMKKIWGEEKCKNCTKFWYIFWAILTLAKTLAADQSNAFYMELVLRP